MKVKEGYVEKIVEKELTATIDKAVSKLDAEFIEEQSEEIKDIAESVKRSVFDNISIDEWYRELADAEECGREKQAINELRKEVRTYVKNYCKASISRLK